MASRSGTRVLRAAIVTIGACLAVTAEAQEGWEAAPATLSAPAATAGAIGVPRVAVDGLGNALAAWLQRISPTDALVQVSRRQAGSSTWSAPATLAGPIGPNGSLAIAADALGHALAVWSATSASGTAVMAARYEAGPGTWQPAVTLSATGGAADLAMNQAGQAVAAWTDAAGLVAARFDTIGGTWTAPATIAGDRPFSARLGIDAAGDAIAVWQTAVGEPVEASRSAAGTNVWSAPAALSTSLPGPGLAGATLAVGDTGDAVVAWSNGTTLEAAHYDAAAPGWSAAATLSAGGVSNGAARAVVDGAGRATLVWLHTSSTLRKLHVSHWDPVGSAWSAAAELPGQDGGFAYNGAIDVDAGGNVHVVWSQSLASPGLRLLASRYATSTSAWTTVSNLSAIGQSAYNPDVAVDPHGNAVAIWFQVLSGTSAIQGLRWSAAPAPPAITGGSPSSGALALTFSLPSAADPALAATNLEYSVDDGATWTTRAPAGTGSPVAIGGLIDGDLYTLRLRAVNAAGQGSASAPASARSGVDASPGHLRVVSRVGNRVTLAWTAPPAGLVPTGYLVEGGFWGQTQVLAVLPSGGAATQMTFDVPNGAYFVRVAGEWNGTRLGTSAPVSFGVGVISEPSAPASLLGSTAGPALALSWRTTWEGAAPTGARLFVFGGITAWLDLPPGESFTFPAVPAGTYTFAVSSVSGAVVGPQSAPVTLTFPGTCTGAPAPPSAFSASTQGGTVFLDWLPPAAGEAVTSYLVSVTGAFTGTFPIAARTLAAPVPPGSYTIRVASVGPCGTSAFTAADTVVVP